MPHVQGRIDYRENHELPKIDARDAKIIEMLVRDARRSIKSISSEVKLSPDAVSYRIKRLEELGVILGAVPLLSYAQLGHSVFHVMFLVDETDDERKYAFFDRLHQHPNVKSVIEYTDSWDLEVVLVARDVSDFDEILLELTESFNDVIIDKEEAMVVRRYNSSLYPGVYDPRLDEPGAAKLADVDEVDMQLIAALCEDARQSSYALSETIGLSPDAVRYRMKRLEEKRVIRGYTLSLNLSLLGWIWRTFAIEVRTFSKSDEQRLKEFLRQHPSIIRAVKVLGHADLLLYILSDSPARFHAVVRDLKKEFARNLTSYETWLAMSEHIHQVLPSDILKG